MQDSFLAVFRFSIRSPECANNNYEEEEKKNIQFALAWV